MKPGLPLSWFSLENPTPQAVMPKKEDYLNAPHISEIMLGLTKLSQSFSWRKSNRTYYPVSIGEFMNEGYADNLALLTCGGASYLVDYEGTSLNRRGNQNPHKDGDRIRWILLGIYVHAPGREGFISPISSRETLCWQLTLKRYPSVWDVSVPRFGRPSK